MLNVIPVEFDHDCWEKEERFREFADAVIASECFDSEPIIEHTPVFSYSRSGRSQLSSLVDRIGDQQAIIFLSDICSYSFIAVQSTSGLSAEFFYNSTYESFSALCTSPIMRGHHVAIDGDIRLANSDCLVVSMLPWGLLNEETLEPNPAIIEIVQKLSTGSGFVYSYRIRDQERYFESACSDWPIYILNESDIDINNVLERYGADELTEYLLSLQMPFGTLNDNHQDDLFTVSYRNSFWQSDDTSMAFIA